MGGDGSDGTEQEQRFRLMYLSHFQSIYRYSARRVGVGHEASDVVADVFTVAWRRIDDAPLPPEELLWLYGVARRVVSEYRRTETRRGRLTERLRSVQITAPSNSLPDETAQDRLIEAMGTLRPDDGEALRLVLWEELSHTEAAQVLGCTVNAVAIRVHRAKARLREALQIEVPVDLPAIPLSRPIDPTRS